MMKRNHWYRKLLRLLLVIKRTIDEQFVNHASHFISHTLRSVLQFTDAAIPIVSLTALGFIVHDLGFNKFYSVSPLIIQVLALSLYALKIMLIAHFIAEWQDKRKFSAHVFSFLLIVLTFYLHSLLRDLDTITNDQPAQFVWKKLLLYGGVFFIFLSEVSYVMGFLYVRRLNPAFLFVISFAVIIFLGGLLLMLPNATHNDISAIDALFTSTSAVCVTGLIVVDTATTFTTFGKSIILFLIQIGGLGIMTFAGLFGYLIAGSVSIQNQLALKHVLSASKINNVIQLVSRIIIVTLFFEAIGAVLIHWSVGPKVLENNSQRLFFAVFHSISAFCNAGFSTLPDGLYTEKIRFNYTLQIIIAALIVLGGMGFPIVFNIFSSIRIRTMNFFHKALKIRKQEKYARIIHINSRLAIYTSAILLVFGFVTYLLFEQHTTLTEHPTTWGKIVTAFFGSVTPRTAGFNTVNLSILTLPTVMIYLLLMWIGASPGSTGGGIKTTTAAVAFLNIGSIIRGKKRTDAFHTQLSENSINRSFAIIMISLLVIGTAVLLIGVNDGDKGMLPIAFEAFSAFSTVGLTLGITSDLGETSKMVLVVVMFVGRVGTLTLLIAFVRQSDASHYHYPKEDIMY